MNLIEQLGGYEKALQFLKSEKNSLEIDPVFYLDGQEILVDVLDDALLEYRRQHNIFEVGDKVVYKPSMVQGVIFTVIGFDDFGWMKTEAFFEGFDHPKRFSEDPPFSDVRHATDEEIKAGKRLEVK